MAQRTYTDAEKTGALKLYLEHGPGEASRRCGIAAGTISQWARRKGVTDTRATKTRAATEAAKAAADEKRAAMYDRMVTTWHDVIDRLNEPHQEFVGQNGKEVHYSKAPAGAVKAYVTAANGLLDKIRLEEGKATDRTEHVTQNEFDREVAELVAKVREAA